MLSGFMAKVEDGNNRFYVDNYVYPAGQVLTYEYYSGLGTRLTWATSVLLVYNSAAPVMAAPNFVYSHPSIINSYTSVISSI